MFWRSRKAQLDSGLILTNANNPTLFPSISPSYQTLSIQYNYSGSVQYFTVSRNLPVYSIYVKVIGGGGGYSDGGAGGLGGSVEAQIKVSPGDVLLITVGKAIYPTTFHFLFCTDFTGGQGASRMILHNMNVSGGYNGGGSGGFYYGAGGGGASSIKIGTSYVVVAGGGG